MLSMRLVSRGNLSQYAANLQRLHTSTVVLDSSSSSSSSDSDKKSSTKQSKTKPVESEEQKQQSRQETSVRLNNLLNLMMKAPKVSKPIDLAIPPKKRNIKVKPQPYEDKVVKAAKDAAAALGGDVEKKESELLNKILPSEGGKSDEQTVKRKSTSIHFNELIAGMKIDRTPAEQTKAPQIINRSLQVQMMAQKFQSMNAGRSKYSRSNFQDKGQTYKKVNLSTGKALQIFNEAEGYRELVEAPKLTTWDALQQKEFKLSGCHPPENVFQELIEWTEQGKLWKFPIDNEQGLEDEQNIHFSEHVFMERHLKDWCPKGGPIRHFMELVCVGLSKNPYMKVNEKIEHILWYREFFGSKQELLKEIGAINEEIPSAKQVEAQ